MLGVRFLIECLYSHLPHEGPDMGPAPREESEVWSTTANLRYPASSGPATRNRRKHERDTTTA